MENKQIYKKIVKDMNFKLNLCYSSSLYQPVEIENINKDKKDINTDPIFDLLEKWEEIQQFINIPYYLPFFYFNRVKVDSILYTEDTEISIDPIKSDDKLFFISNLYLTLLIEDNPNMINYIYPFELIKILNEMKNKEDKKNNIKILIMAKILNSLIMNFENSNIYDDSLEDEFLSYKENIKDIINDNEKLLEEYQLKKEDFLKTKIDEIYSSIIKQLIIKDQLNESEKTYKIMKSLDLENFYITKSIFDELKNALNMDRDYIKKYEINQYEDIFDDKILTFYYMLFKFILKNQIYIYQIPFLLITRKNILKNIKKNIEKLNDTLKENRRNKDKIIYVLNYFMVFDYYYQYPLKKSLKSRESSYIGNIQMDQNNNYYSGNENSSSSFNLFNNQSYKSAKEKSGRSLDIFEEPEKSEYEQIKEKCEKEDAFQILDYSTFSFHTNRKGSQSPIIFDEISVAYQNRKFTIDKIKNITTKDESLNKNYKKFLNVLETVISRINNEFHFQYKLKINLNFKTIDIKNSQFIIECYYRADIPTEKPCYYKDENILENGFTSGFPYLLNEINNEIYNDLKYED